MRRIAAFLIPLAVVACGGGSEPTQPVPPVGSGTPATLAITAGDNQEADAGTPVPVRPSAIVKDAMGRPVPGTQVTFVVETGGGQIAGADAISGANGVATAGDWTLGPLEGPNTLTARVAGLPVVTFRAQAKPAPRIIADTTLPGTGGTIAVIRHGDPASGVRVVVPAGAYSGPTRVTLRVLPSVALTLPEGVSQVGPILEVGGFPAAYSDSLLTLRIPVAVPEGSAAAAFIRDPSTGRLELLSPIGQDSASITVATRHFAPGLMMPSAGALVSPPARALSAAQIIHVIVVQALKSRLAQGVDSQFRPGRDDWEFPNYGSFLSPGGHCAGQSIAAMYYYLRWKAIKGPLSGTFAEDPGSWYSNPRGYRFSSVVQERLDWDNLSSYFALLALAAGSAAVTLDELHFHALAIALVATREPQFLAVLSNTGGHAVIAYRVESGRVLVSDPNFPGESHAVAYGNRAFQPYLSKPNAGAAGKSYPVIRTAGTTVMIPTASLDALWSQVEGRTIGNAEFPSVRIEYFNNLTKAWDILGDTVRSRQDTLLVRAACPTCPYRIAGSGALQLQPIHIDRPDGTGTGTEGGDGVLDYEPPVGPSRLGIYVTSWTGPSSPQCGGLVFGTACWLDYRKPTVVQSPFTLSPDTAKAVPDSVVRFTARPNGDFPAAARYVWDFGDGTPAVTVGLDSVVDHAFTREGTFPVTVELRDGQGGALVAKAVRHARINKPRIRWRLTTLIGAAPPWAGAPGPTAIEYANYGAFFGAIAAQPSRGLLEYLERHPEADNTPAVSLALDPAGTGNVNFTWLGRSSDRWWCQTVDQVQWTGGVSSGAINGTWVSSCPRDITGASIDEVTLRLAATKLGNAIAGNLRVTYADYTKERQTVTVNGQQREAIVIKPLGTYEVLYTFTGVREDP